MSDQNEITEFLIEPTELHIFIKEHRDKEGLTLDKAGNRIGREKSNYQKLEFPDSNPEMKTVSKWAHANNMKVQLLFTHLIPNPAL